MDIAEREQRIAELAAKLQDWDTENLDCGSAAQLRELVQDVQLTAFDSGYTAGRDGESKFRDALEESNDAKEAKFLRDLNDHHEAELREAWEEGQIRGHSEGFSDGMSFSSQIHQEDARKKLARYVLSVLGKDIADGPIDLGALGKGWFADSE
jgi:hypothetical protein